MFQQDSLEVYQIRIWLKEISPMIWRRLLVRNDSTIADFHHCIQIAMGWEDEHLHQFVIQGKAYGIGYSGGMDFSDDARKIYLKDFYFRSNEKFKYEYDFSDNWVHEIRIEKKLPIDPKKTYPLCIGGSRAAPPEDCGGPCAFMELEDHYFPWDIERKLIRLIKKHQATEDEDEDDVEEEDAEETFQKLIYWANRHRFNRHEVNCRLRKYFSKGEDAKEDDDK